jgi:hypothetical protein
VPSDPQPPRRRLVRLEAGFLLNHRTPAPVESGSASYTNG